MEITISLSVSDLERIKNTLGITGYDDIHEAIIDAFNLELDESERLCDKNELIYGVRSYEVK